ncbi:MAG: NAD(P)-dependent oxidoreductase [Paracoccaceae bacterium]
MTLPTIAILGTGFMGAPMARNLLKGGFRVKAWNRTAQKAEALAGDGAEVCGSAADAVSGADFVITMLSDGATVDAMTRDKAVTDALKGGAIWVDMSSTKPAEARAQSDYLSGLGFARLDAPVSGGTKGAEEATLAIMVGGDAASFEAARPVLSAMGRATHVGPTGSGQLAKLANQAIVGATIAVVAEATLLVKQGGGDPDAMREALKGGFADSRILQLHGARMTSGDYTPGAMSTIQLKDMVNIVGEGELCGIELPVSQSVRDRFAYLCDELGEGEKDHAALYLELLARNGLSQ